jgi:UDP-N-acetylmuramoylalanine--D-glutamate ligase
MHIRDLEGKSILILGYGKEGQAAARALQKNVQKYALTIAEKYPDPELMGMDFIGMHAGAKRYLPALSTFDVIIKSPGIPPNDELRGLQGKVTSGTQIFLDTALAAGASVIGITGSKGKSTTTTLIYECLKAAGKDVHLVGNIGIPALDFLDRAQPGVTFVQEMSSYQLMDLTTSPPLAVVTSFFPEHLDYHGSLEAYREAKSHIAAFQKPGDTVFFNDEFPDARWIAERSPGAKVPFNASQSPVTLEETKLLGRHNLGNIAGAYAVMQHLGIPDDACLPVFRSFQGLPHRLQSLGTHHGIEWIDDAISTTPESAMAALDALGDRVATIILGGQDRGLDFAALGQRIARSSVKTVILFPDTGVRIREAIGDAHADVCFQPVTNMEAAVDAAKTHTMEGKICLLSTASPSYNMFKNFEEKGDLFKAAVYRDA